MEEIDRFIAEIVRIRRYVQIYIELFTENESINALENISSEVFGIIQKAMHDEILISLSRLYDGKGFEYKKEYRENLSQFNIVSQYEDVLTDTLNNLRAQTSDLFERINIKQYRDTKVAHNDKETLLGKNGIIKHNIDSKTVISLLETSLKLAIGIKSKVQQKENVSLPVMITECYEGKGKALIEKMIKI